jgi:copper chaperone NosL
MRLNKAYTLLCLVPLLLLSACTPEPQPIHFGHDQCTHCKMLISQDQYGAELVTTKGKIFKFDSIECLAAHQIEGRVDSEDVHSLWVVDFNNPPHLLPLDEAFFLHSRDLRSPMGLNLTAFGPGIQQSAVLHAFYGEIIDWPQVLDLVRTNPTDHGTMQPTGRDVSKRSAATSL